MNSQESGEKFRGVKGTVRRTDQSPVEGARVAVFRKHLRSEDRIGEAHSRDSGHYQISHESDAPENLVVRVYDAAGAIAYESQPLYKAHGEVILDITVPVTFGGATPELDRVLKSIHPYLGTVALDALTPSDVDFLANAAGVAVDLLHALRSAAALEKQTYLPLAAFYGLLREGNPSGLRDLLLLPDDTLKTDLTDAGRSSYIAPLDQLTIDAFLKKFDELRKDPQYQLAWIWAARILDEATGLPVAGAQVKAMFLGKKAYLGTPVTSSDGVFTLHLAVVKPASNQPRTIHLTLTTSNGVTIDPVDVQVNPGAQQTQEIRVTIPPPPPPPPPRLDYIAAQLGPVPASLITELGNLGIQTVQDLQAAGNLADIPGLKTPPSDSGVIRLQAHADLSRISPDTTLNSYLIDTGFTSLHAIATTTQSDFVKAVADRSGDFTAAALHTRATAFSHLVSNVVQGALAAPPATQPDWVRQNLEQYAGAALDRCDCEDCQMAISPLAYLADLLDYAVRHLKVSGKAIDLAFLVNTFYQPFDKLSASCESLDAIVREVRICIEVLRRYLADKPPTAAQAAALAVAEAAYTEAAWEGLLAGIGTNSEEVRTAASASAAIRTALADKLGIDIGGPRPDALDALILTGPTLTEAALEDLFGLVDTTRDPLAPGPTPKLQTWRIAHLRTIWKLEDWPADYYASGVPIIDPDVIGPDDFRSPKAKPLPASPDAAFDVWIKRRDWVDGRLTALAAITKVAGGKTVPDLDALFASMYTPLTYDAATLTPWAATTKPPDFDSVALQLTVSASDADAATATARILKDLALDPGEFLRLLAIRDKDNASIDPRNETVQPGEWQEVFSILVEAGKRAFFPAWIAEEKSDSIELGPATFWPITREPRDGDWPPLGLPVLIDPELVSLNDLPDPTAGQPAIDFWNARETQLQKLRDDLETKRKASGLDAELLMALGDPSPGNPLPVNITTLAANLASGVNLPATTAAIQNQLFMSVPDFLVMMAIKAKDADPSPLAKPVESDWETLNAVLSAASKRKRQYPVWHSEEQAPGTGVVYWQALRAKLPAWRAPAGARQAWTTSLQDTTTPPIVDSDLIGPADLINPVAGDNAFALWQARRSAIDGEIAALQIIRASAASDLAAFDAMVLSALLVDGKEIAAIQAASDAGARISPRLAQLGLDFNSFNFLSGIRSLAVGAATILETEWDQVKAILTEVWKQRLFPSWRRQEMAAGVLLSQDEFRNRATAEAGSVNVQDGIALMPWLAGLTARQDWVDRLQARIDQDAGVAQGLAQAVDIAESAALAQLRDALLLASAAAGTDLATKASWVTLHLAIDAEESTCQKTTRVAQAIETIQDIIFSVRAHDPGEVFPDVVLDADHFDEEWIWLGSYSAWRSAMLVFLFPENVAAPTLKPAQTPAFKALVRAVEGNAQLDRRAACEAARQYSVYFRNICTLLVTASCDGYSRLRQQDRCAGIASDQWHMLLYMFGQGSASQDVYWSTYDWTDTTGQAQTFWAALPGLDGHNVDMVAGSFAFFTPAAKTYVYVFMRGNTNGANTLLFERIPTETQIPEGVAWALDLPAGWTSFTINVLQPGGGGVPPVIGLTLSNGEVWERQMDPTGMRWGTVDWRRLNHWMDWSPIGDRKVMSSPKHPPVSALSRYKDHLEVFWVDADGGKVFTTFWDTRVNNAQWVQPYQIGTLTTSTTCGIVPLSRTTDHIDLFTVGDDGSVFTTWWDFNVDGARWHDWFRLGPPGIADTRSQIAAVCQSPNHIDLFVIGPDNGLWSTWWDANPANGQWPAWFPIGARNLNTRYQVSACSRTNGRLDVFLIQGDGQVLTTHWDADPSKGQWPNWTPLNGQPITYGETCPAIARKPDHIDLFVFDLSGQVSQAVWDQNLNGANWSFWNVIEPVQKSFNSPVAAVSRFPDQLDVFFLFADSLGRTSVQSTWWDANIDGGAWHPYFTIGNFLAADQHSFPAVSWDANRIDLFVIGTDQKIYTSWFQSADWYTAKPLLLPPVWVKPFDIGPYDVTNDLSSSALQLRRLFVEWNVVVNLLAPDSIQEYLREAYFFVPMFLGMQLENRGQYQAALDWYRTTYDYGAPVSQRKIYFGLVLEESGATVYKRGADWLLDPLNPHKIARTRPNCYTRFTLQTIIRCFIDWADNEFSRDTPESVPRARTLYLAALELCLLPDLVPPGQHCGDTLGSLEIDIGDGHWEWVWWWLKKQVVGLSDLKTVEATVSKVKAAMSKAAPLADRMGEAIKIVAAAKASAPPRPTIAETNATRNLAFTRISSAFLAQPDLARAAVEAGDAAVADLQVGVAEALNLSPEAVTSPAVKIPWLRQPVTPPNQGKLKVSPPPDAQTTAPPRVVATAPLALSNNLNPPRGVSVVPAQLSTTLAPTSDYANIISDNPIVSALIPRYGYIHWVPPPSFYFCVPGNPVLKSLRSHIDLDLYKIRHCMNIAGLSRQLEPYAAPTTIDSGLPAIGPAGTISLPSSPSFQPTLYRYSTLIERAKQLVQLAAQIEGSMLTALEQLATEQYALIKARQDVQLAYAGVQLQTLRVQDAMDGVILGQLQQQRAQIVTQHYQDLLNQGISEHEQDQIDLLNQSAALGEAAAAINAAAALQSAFSVDSFIKSGSGATALVATSLGSLAGAFGAQASVAAAMAGYERRAQDWQLQAALGQQDVRIGAQQVAVAQDQVRVAGQELTIAQMTADNASAIADYLANKFTNAELFQWMSQILSGVYSFFLQQATVMASLAQNQLSFERQQVTPAFIQSDYWQVQSTSNSQDANSPDRMGLTGSARLLQDIYKLDQYAFQTDQRKLQMTKTFSLATLAPFEFQRLRESGVIRFATPMELFDRDFPGHYLRLIRQVKVTVVALVPPAQGIRAMLLSSGLSRVVIDGTPPETAVIRRQPESIALTSTVNATGLFDLQPADGMLFPFEGSGVDTAWEFRMPRAANPWDFSSLADVLFTVDHTALDSYDQRQRVLRTMSSRTPFVRGYNFRFDLEDTWYDLNNPDESATPMTVRFDTTAQDFPPNLTDLRITQVLLYFSRADGASFEVAVKKLSFTPAGSSGSTGGAASTLDGCVSTLRGNGGSWLALIGKVPVGTWEMSLPNTEQMRGRFANGEIGNILFMLTIEGLTPAWPA